MLEAVNHVRDRAIDRARHGVLAEGTEFLALFATLARPVGMEMEGLGPLGVTFTRYGRYDTIEPMYEGRITVRTTTARDLAPADRNHLGAALCRGDQESIRYQEGAAALQSAELRACDDVRASL